ncbi:G patch domain-containing protein 2-like isoform X1 [Thunnus maccoyii]|uniref:G patch domain-containing protein 2-like isoform X1 n=2 Tax=Thunnus maccoyii TaxID=8240 RepID=UPI001C4CD981|nr:G patch domain-containing protein 2-like isoform X1 [Thunnus maccoyii]
MIVKVKCVSCVIIDSCVVLICINMTVMWHREAEGSHWLGSEGGSASGVPAVLKTKQDRLRLVSSVVSLVSSIMMDELVRDLVSALEQTSEQSKLGELWEEMVLNPLHQRRQIRRRRGRKRHRESSLYPLEHRRCWIEASESSLDEASKNYRGNARSAFRASVAYCSDSDDMTATNQWHSLMRGGPTRTRQPSWPESDSFTENNPGRPLRRRRKVKRMTSDVTVRLQQKLKVSGVDGKRRHRPSRMQHLSGSKNRSGGWVGADRQTEGARLMGKECWKSKITLEAKEHRDGGDENMSEGETSSTCSSDPGLFTNDEGRQGDDEQSDWFFEGDCGVGSGVASLLPSWDSDNQLSLEDNRPSPTFLQPARPSQRGYHSHLKRLPGTAACCIRKDRRRPPSKGNRMPVFVERLRHFSQDPYQRDFWLPSVGKRDRSQWNPLCQLPVCPIDMVSESSRLRCSSSVCRNRQTNVTPGLLRTGDIRRRRKTEAVSITTSASNPFHKDHQKEEAQGASSTSTLEAVSASGAPSAAGSRSSTSAKPESLSFSQGDHEDT